MASVISQGATRVPKREASSDESLTLQSLRKRVKIASGNASNAANASALAQQAFIKREFEAEPTLSAIQLPSSVLPLTEDEASEINKYRFTFESTGKPWKEVIRESLELFKEKHGATSAPTPLPAAGRSQQTAALTGNDSQKANDFARNYRIPKDAMGMARDYRRKKMIDCPKSFVIWLAGQVRKGHLQRWVGLPQAIMYHYPELSLTLTDGSQAPYKLSKSPKDSIENWIKGIPGPPPAAVESLLEASLHPQIKSDAGEPQPKIKTEPAESDDVLLPLASYHAREQGTGGSPPQALRLTAQAAQPQAHPQIKTEQSVSLLLPPCQHVPSTIPQRMMNRSFRHPKDYRWPMKSPYAGLMFEEAPEVYLKNLAASLRRVGHRALRRGGYRKWKGVKEAFIYWRPDY